MCGISSSQLQVAYDTPLARSPQEEQFALSFASIGQKLVDLLKKGDKLVYKTSAVQITNALVHLYYIVGLKEA